MNTSQHFTIHQFASLALQRTVRMDIYVPSQLPSAAELDILFMNDGQDLLKMDIMGMINGLQKNGYALAVVAVHAGTERKIEYGVSGKPDFMKRGSKADAYARCMMEELIPFANKRFDAFAIRHRSIAGFSLGGLMAFDLAMDYPDAFQSAGVFSGSFWWRSKDLKDGYVEERDRIIHAKIRSEKANMHQRFYMQTGTLDEKADRNKNGIIDSIDDTLDIIKELTQIGFKREEQITYVEILDGTHDAETWSKAMPDFLHWLSVK